MGNHQSAKRDLPISKGSMPPSSTSHVSSTFQHAQDVVKKLKPSPSKHLGSRLPHVQTWPRRDLSKHCPSSPSSFLSHIFTTPHLEKTWVPNQGPSSLSSPQGHVWTWAKRGSPASSPTLCSIL
ncbi:hypothetical protein PIB30_090554 [Stylosanthes scabra]|uniref:Uncharacterized protein n=1 Tax=Stylosanthes scabra TaxID=79078 RepID=A0ABU6XV03_9FABA|nr:hypothetical protein [Stylosanthes scabra]